MTLISVNESHSILYTEHSAARQHDLSVLFLSFIIQPLWLILTGMPVFLEGTGCFGECLFCVITLGIMVQFYWRFVTPLWHLFDVVHV